MCKIKPVFGEEKGGRLRHGNHHCEEGEGEQSCHSGELERSWLVDTWLYWPHLRPVQPCPADETDENAKVSESGGQKTKPAAHLWSETFSQIDGQGERHGADAEAGQGSAEADGEHTGGLGDQHARQAERQGGQEDGHLGMIQKFGGLITFLPSLWRESPPARPPTRAARGIREPIHEASASDTASLNQELVPPAFFGSKQECRHCIALPLAKPFRLTI